MPEVDFDSVFHHPEATMTTATTDRKVHKTDIEGRVVYRGVTIDRHDRERGYSGHYRTAFKLSGTYVEAPTLRDLKHLIDRLLAD
jgi:hypothetical protein